MATSVELLFTYDPPDPMLGVSSYSLGNMAVEADLKLLGASSLLDQGKSIQDSGTEPPLIDTALLEKIRQVKDDRISDIREQASNFDTATDEKYHRIIDQTAPNFIQYRYELWKERRLQLVLSKSKFPEGQDTSWGEWLRTGATDQELLNFAQWNTHRLEELRRNPEIVSKISEAKDIFKHGIESGVAGGHLHHDALDKLDSIAQGPVLIEDFTGMEAKQRLGYMYHNSRPIYIAESGIRENGKHDMLSIFLHEKVHHLGGIADLWTLEALVEHIAQSVMDDKWDILDPKAHDERAAYQGCRRLLDALAQGGAYPIPASTFMWAFSRISSDLEIDMEHAVDRAYGRNDVLYLLDVEIQIRMKKFLDIGNSLSVATDMAAMELSKEWENSSERQNIFTIYDSYCNLFSFND